MRRGSPTRVESYSDNPVVCEDRRTISSDLSEDIIKPFLSRRSFVNAALLTYADCMWLGRTVFASEAARAPKKTRLQVTSSESVAMSEIPAPQWTRHAEASEVTISQAASAYPLLGFGAAFTDAACIVLHRMPESVRAGLLKEMFSPEMNGFSTIRIPIGASDYSATAYSYDDGEEDPTLSRFSIDHDRASILPVLKDALQINPKIFCFGSPWSPPGWMKYGGSMAGGTIRPKNIKVYAQYLARFVEAYRQAGIPIQAITTQNEIDADQAGRMPACTWPAEEELALVVELKRLLQATGTQVWTLDHNYDLWGRAVSQLTKPEFHASVNAVAWHGYVGTPDSMMKVRDLFPDIQMHWTEGGPDIDAPTYGTDWCDWAATFCDILRYGAQSITAWNAALDEHGNPNIGPFRCGGLVTIDSGTGKLRRSGMYWALAHFSRAFDRGARPLKCSIETHDLSSAAALNPDGSRALVLSNKGDARTVMVSEGDFATSLTLPKDSVVHLRWQ